MERPTTLLILNFDGLRRDVLHTALAAGALPNLERIVGRGASRTAYHVPAISTAPSITFTAQASIVTGCHPGAHGVAGNETFDRLGRISNGSPRHFGFDVGDTLAVDDAVAVFTGSGLAARYLAPECPTLYERAAARGLTSVVAHHIYARGAQTWLPPDLVDIARFTKGRGALGLEAGAYDAGMLRTLLKYLETGSRPNILMVYFMGLDHHSHAHGPASQPDYLREVVDPQVGLLLDALAARGLARNALFVLVSDHGQIEAIPDDQHSLRLGFPFDLELGHVFKALRLDVHDFPGEDPNCDAVMGLNGGLAHVYLQRRDRHWADFPRYQEDVLPVAEAFYAMNAAGRYATELHDTLDLVLIRNVERDGWNGMYDVYLGAAGTQPLGDYLAAHPELPYVDAVNRLRLAASPTTGDLILVAKGRAGFYFGSPTRGVHGGLLPGESEAVLSFAMPGGDAETLVWLREIIAGVIAARCANEGNRCPSVADCASVIAALLDF